MLKVVKQRLWCVDHGVQGALVRGIDFDVFHHSSWVIIQIPGIMINVVLHSMNKVFFKL